MLKDAERNICIGDLSKEPITCQPLRLMLRHSHAIIRIKILSLLAFSFNYTPPNFQNVKKPRRLQSAQVKELVLHHILEILFSRNEIPDLQSNLQQM